VSHRAYGKTHEYYPAGSRDEYRKSYVKSFIGRYFGDSFQDLVSFFASGRDVSLQEMEEIRRLLREEIAKQKGDER
jgi:predicted transcriptional regulator